MNFVYGNLETDDMVAPMIELHFIMDDEEGSLHGDTTLQEALKPVYEKIYQVHHGDFPIDAFNFVLSFMIFYTSQKEMARQIVDDEYLALMERLSRTKSSSKINKLKKWAQKLSSSKVLRVEPMRQYKWKLREVLSEEDRDLPLNSEKVKRAMRLHIVSGHFKKQVYGPGRQFRKLIYIEPYWRGKETSDGKGRTIIVH